MTSLDIKDAYFAGLIDGEGHIGLAKKGNGVRPLIHVNMTCFRSISALHGHFGVGTVRPKAKPSNPKWKQQWVWRIYYYDAIGVALRIRPYLIAKADDADRIIAYTPMPRGRPSKGGLAPAL
jgi:hypothetical protein